MRILPAATAALILGASVALTGPALAHGDRDRLDQKRSEYDARLNAPVAMSPSVSLVDSNPGSAGISGCFMKTAPLFVMSGLDSVVVHDVSNPLDPKRVGTMPSLQFENEAVNCGERKVGRTTQRFALIGVDVTDPTNPRIRSRARPRPAPTR